MGNFIQNSAWLTVSNGTSNFFLLLFNFLLIKLYGPALHGQFAFALSLLLFLRMFFDMGLCNYLTKAIAKKPHSAGKIFYTVSSLIFTLGLMAVVVWVLVPVLQPNLTTPSHMYFLLWFVAHQLISMTANTFIGLGLAFQVFLVHLFYGVSLIMAVVLLGFGGWEFKGFVAGLNICVFAAGIATCLLLLPHINRWSSAPLESESKKGIFLEALTLWLPGITISLFPQIMTILVDFGYTDSQVSVFSTLLAWSMISMVLLGPAGQALFAWTASLDKNYSERDRHSIELYFRVLGFISLFFSLLLLALSPAIRWAYGTAYLIYPGVFAILIFAQAADFPRYFTTPLLSGGSHARLVTRIELLKFIFIVAAGGWIAYKGFPLWFLAVLVLGIQFMFSLLRLFYVKKVLSMGFTFFYLRILTLAALGCSVSLLDITVSLKCALLLGVFLVSGVKPKDIGLIVKYWRSKEGFSH